MIDELLFREDFRRVETPESIQRAALVRAVKAATEPRRLRRTDSRKAVMPLVLK
jgi:hypothetical protein